jgi:hypothetical protein
MNQTFPVLLLASVALWIATLSPSRAQAPAGPADVPPPELKELRLQQTALQENEKKIDEKIAAIAEEIRQARIYVSRGGKK